MVPVVATVNGDDGDGDDAYAMKADPSAAASDVFVHGGGGLTAGVAGAACAASSAMALLGL